MTLPVNGTSCGSAAAAPSEFTRAVFVCPDEAGAGALLTAAVLSAAFRVPAAGVTFCAGAGTGAADVLLLVDTLAETERLTDAEVLSDVLSLPDVDAEAEVLPLADPDSLADCPLSLADADPLSDVLAL